MPCRTCLGYTPRRHALCLHFSLLRETRQSLPTRRLLRCSLHRAIREARRPLHEDTIWRVLLHTALALHHMHSRSGPLGWSTNGCTRCGGVPWGVPQPSFEASCKSEVHVVAWALHPCRRIIHRDVKSLNVFVTGPLDDHSQPPKFKLGDVGISKVRNTKISKRPCWLRMPAFAARCCCPARRPACVELPSQLPSKRKLIAARCRRLRRPRPCCARCAGARGGPHLCGDLPGHAPLPVARGLPGAWARRCCRGA